MTITKVIRNTRRHGRKRILSKFVKALEQNGFSGIDPNLPRICLWSIGGDGIHSIYVNSSTITSINKTLKERSMKSLEEELKNVIWEDSIDGFIIFMENNREFMRKLEEMYLYGRKDTFYLRSNSNLMSFVKTQSPEVKIIFGLY